MANWCKSCLYEEYDGAEEPCINCMKPQDANPTEYFPKRPPKPVTNYDRLIAKTPEELAKWIGEQIDCECCPVAHDEPISGTDECHKRILDWLKEKVTE